MEQVVKNLIGMKHAFFLIVGQILVLSGLGFSSSSKLFKKKIVKSFKVNNNIR